MIIDQLVEAIKVKRNPTVVGLDTTYEFLPPTIQRLCNSPADIAVQITDYNRRLIDGLKDIVPAVKVQSAYYEMYGWDGMRAFAETLDYAKACGLITIADVKRNDIGATAKAYAQAYLSGFTVNFNDFRINDDNFKNGVYDPNKGEYVFRPQLVRYFNCDFMTVNGYLGSDGVMPFVDACRENDKGIFILVKTSNPSSDDFQDLNLRGNTGTVYRRMAKFVHEWGSDLKGTSGFSPIGAVVGATRPEQGAELRHAFPSMFFLIPGFGAQGARASDVRGFFRDGEGGIVNNSRGIISAWQKKYYQGMTAVNAAIAAATDMRNDLRIALDL
ncbi:MAG: orotidine-5'-phosphate decarboxylase [Clostridiaceae bacterium]|jgi:orotidine-5'-phosphate decarboxylase|nr:orotidine-5'-phosphate decarboxylase [Clostridiaceae bacterium]